MNKDYEFLLTRIQKLKQNKNDYGFADEVIKKAYAFKDDPDATTKMLAYLAKEATDPKYEAYKAEIENLMGDLDTERPEYPY